VVKKRRYGKKKSKPSGAERNKVQGVKDRYAHAREDAQLTALIPTTPEEALTPERVDPSVQSEQRFPALIGRAIRQGWAVPDERKPGYVDELAEVLEDPEAAAVAKVMAFNALLKGDQLQHERDQEYVRLDRVLEMWRGVLEAIRNHVQDQAVLKAIVADVLRFLPAPSAGQNVLSRQVNREVLRAASETAGAGKQSCDEMPGMARGRSEQ
jgi:hypothetical protein